MSKQGEGCDRAQVCEITGNSTRPVGRVRIQLNSNAELITGNRITGTAYDDVSENIITHTHTHTHVRADSEKDTQRSLWQRTKRVPKGLRRSGT